MFRRSACSPLLTFVVVHGLYSSGMAADWPAWRGPGRDAISKETGLLDRWDRNGPPLAWRIDGLGKGYSSVAIWDGRIYTLGNRKGGAELIALSLDDGRELWAARVGGGDPNCTPTVDPDSRLVYALGRDGHLLCANAETGAEVWRTSFKDDFGGRMMSGWGYSESPLIDGDRLICTPGARDALLVALDKRTGETIWKSAAGNLGQRGNDGAAYSSPVVSTAAGIRQYVQLTGRGIVSVAADDGRLLWSYNRIANGTANIPTPIIKDNFVFCSTGYETGAALLEVKSAGRGRARVEERYFLPSREMQNHHGGMVLVGDHIYCGHGHNLGLPLCLEMRTGKVAWRSPRRPGGGSAAVLYADGDLYFRYEDGTMALIEANPRKFVLKGTFPLASKNGSSWPHPVIVDRKLYLRDQQTLLCYDVAK